MEKPKKQQEPKAKDVSSSSTLNSQDTKPAAKESCLLLIRLTGSSDPTITRLLSVPSSFTFTQFHQVLQVKFEWATCYANSFSASKFLEFAESHQDHPNFMTGCGKDILTLEHDNSIENAFPDPDQIKKESDYTLADIYDGDEYREKVEVSHEYDHGDSWGHQIALLGRADPSMRKAMQIPDNMRAVYLGGELRVERWKVCRKRVDRLQSHPCAEDASGSRGWEDLEAAFKKRGDPDGRKTCYKEMCANGDERELDPYKWDILDVNGELSKIK